MGNTVFASGWERDVARFFNLLTKVNVLEGWEYEPQTFTFQGLGYKRGPFTYRPDFAIRFTDSPNRKILETLKDIGFENLSGTVYVEVKGQETGNDRSKWRRFRKHVGYPLEVIKRDELKMIQEVFSPIIEHWESNVR